MFDYLICYKIMVEIFAKSYSLFYICLIVLKYPIYNK